MACKLQVVGCQSVVLNSRFILICHITIVDQRRIQSNMTNLVLDFGQLRFGIRHLLEKLQFELL